MISIIKLPKFVWFWCILWLGVGGPDWRTVWPAAPQDWEVMQIYIPSDPDRQKQIIPLDYRPIEIDQLLRELAAERQRRRDQLINAAQLAEATYVCKLDGDTLTSDCSYWKFQGDPASRLIDLGSISVAIREARGLGEDALQLSQVQQYTLDGNLEVFLESSPQECWFGFSSQASRSEGPPSLSMRLPAATHGRMLIATPANYRLSSSSVAVEPIDDPNEFLPSQWPNRPGDYGLPSITSRWWLVHVSGVAQVQLQFETGVTSADPEMLHVVNSAQVDYLIGEADTRIHSRFRLGNNTASRPIRFRISPGLRVNDLRINGMQARWQAVLPDESLGRYLESNLTTEFGPEGDDSTANRSRAAYPRLPFPLQPWSAPEEIEGGRSTSDDSQATARQEIPVDGERRDSPQPHRLRLIELMDSRELAQGTSIEVAATRREHAVGQTELPRIDLLRGHVLDGTTRVVARRGMHIEDVYSPGQNFQLREGVVDTLSFLRAAAAGPSIGFARSSSSVQPSSKDLSSAYWESRWSGRPDTTHVRRSVVESFWKLDALTQLTLQSDWLAAQGNVRLSCDDLRSNELRLVVDESWFIDSARIANRGSNEDVRVDFLERTDVGDRQTQIIVSWERQRDSIEIELEVAAHSPRSAQVDRIHLPPVRMLHLPGAEESQHFVVESSGRFQLEPNAELVRRRVATSELPAWKQSIIGQSRKAWVLHAVGGRTPAINFVASGGTYATQITASLSLTSRTARQVHRITCKPISGSVDQLLVTVPNQIESRELSFEYFESNDSPAMPIEMDEFAFSEELSSASGGRAGEREILLKLPNAQSGEFEIVAEYAVDARQAPIPVFLIGIPHALSTESLLVLPRRLARFDGQLDVDFLPASSCCSVDQLDQLAKNLVGTPATSLIALRAEGHRSQIVRLLAPQPPHQPGWIESQTLITRVHDRGYQTHHGSWQLVSGEAASLTLQLPAQWGVQRVQVDDQLIDDFRSLDGSTIEIPLPTNRRCEMEIDFRQQQPVGGWLRNLVLRKPLLSLPTLASQRYIEISPRFISLKNISYRPETGRLADRLKPANWWSLLEPGLQMVDATQPSPQATASHTPGVGLWTRLRIQDAPKGRELWVVDRNACAAIILAAVLLMGTFFWLTLGRSPRVWWLTISLLAVCVVLVPFRWVPLAQLIVLAAVLAAVSRLVQVAVATQCKGNRRDVSRWWGPVASVGIGLSLVSIATTTSAQESSRSDRTRTSNISPNASSQSSDSSGTVTQDRDDGTNRDAPDVEATGRDVEPTEAARNEIFGILVPVDEENRLSSIYVQVPTRLWDLLTSSNRTQAREGPPRIISSDYTLDIQPGGSATFGMEYEGAQSLTFDLVIRRYPDSDETLRIPIDSSEMELIAARLDDQEVSLNTNTISQQENEVVIEDLDIGSNSVRLEFALKPRGELGGTYRIAPSIPAVASSTLIVSYQDAANISIDSVGKLERLSNGDYRAHIGPLSRLDVSWREVTEEQTNGQSVAVASELWCHATELGLTAACQLKIDNPRLLPRTLHVSVDGDWRPIGTSWGDAELESVESSTLVSRNVYKLRLDRSVSELGESAEITVIMVPSGRRESSKLALPFMSLQEVSQQSTKRVLGWSSEGAATWIPENTDYWDALPTNEVAWEWVEWDTQPTLYQVPAMAASLQLRRQTEPVENGVAETTSVRFDLWQSHFKYEAVWESPLSSHAILRLKLPPTAVAVEQIRVNGREVDFSTHKGTSSKLVRIPLAEQQIDRVFDLELDGYIDNEPEQQQLVPRILLNDSTIRSSKYLFFHAPDVRCQVAPTSDSSIVVEEADRPLNEQLRDMQVLFGRATLSQTQFAELSPSAVSLPLSFTVSETSLPEHISWWSRLEPDADDGWKLIYNALWPVNASSQEQASAADTPQDSYIESQETTGISSGFGVSLVFWDAPLEIRERIDTMGTPRSFLPASGVERTILCLPPTTRSDGLQEIRFSVSLEDSIANRTLTLPDVHLLAAEPLSPLLALPRSINEQAVQWLKVGRAIQDDQLRPDLPEEDEDKVQEFDIFQLSELQNQVSWRPVEQSDRDVRVTNSLVQLVSVTPERVSGTIEFWIEPRGRPHADVEIPESSELLGIQCGQETAVWHTLVDGTKRVTLQPNFLPVRMRLFLAWSHRNAADPFQIELPRVRTGEQPDHFYMANLDAANWRIGDLAGDLAAPQSIDQQIEVQLWAELLARHIAGKTQRVTSSDYEAWLKHWSPGVMRFSGDDIFDVQSLPAGIREELAITQASTMTANQFWQELCAQLNVSDELAQQTLATDDRQAEIASSSIGTSDSTESDIDTKPDDDASNLWRVAGRGLSISKRHSVDNPLPRLIAASLVAAASLLTVVFARRFANRYFDILARHPWLYWLQLAGLAWLLLPVNWPSTLLTVVSVGMLTSQLFDQRGRVRVSRVS